MAPSGWNRQEIKMALSRKTEGEGNARVRAGQRIRAKTNLEPEIPVGRLEYVFVHEDAPGEKVTIPHYVTSPPEGGKVEVFLDR